MKYFGYAFYAFVVLWFVILVYKIIEWYFEKPDIWDEDKF